MSARQSLLVGDIGGTNCRFALAGDDLRPTDAGVEPGDAHPDLESAIGAYLEKSGARADVAAFAVASPIVAGRPTRLTNRRDWVVDPNAIARRFGFARVIVMNDFVAQAASLPRLGPDELVPIGDAAPAEGLKVAVGPGTGLGVAALAPDGTGWRPLPGEGGHIELAAIDEREWAALGVVRRALGRVEAEAVLSGPGMVRLHVALAEIDGAAAPEKTSAEIVALAENGDARALETTDRFVAMFARFCGDLALLYAAEGGVYVCGGIAPRMLKLIDATAFRSAFEAKGSYDAMLRNIATSIVIAPAPGLLGCAAEAWRRLAAGEQ
ncbi:glucokinase [Methylopila sp. M107]|uniref:glucokinase n=1 Tax=Methylopila sp. M107 TaxID=1101190 RepID=UPI00037B52CC|nr:glucokinase [Methylopila sp. M107]